MVVHARRQGQGRGGAASSRDRRAPRSRSRTSSSPSTRASASRARSPTSSRSQAGQELSLDSKRSISGDLELSVPDGGPVISVLSIAKGKVNKTFTKLSLTGTIEGEDGPVVVKLKGVRPPSSFPVLTGRTTEGEPQGQGREEQGARLLGVTQTTCSACLPTRSRPGAGRDRQGRGPRRDARRSRRSRRRASRRSGSWTTRATSETGSRRASSASRIRTPRAEAGSQSRSRAQAEAEGTAHRAGRADPAGHADDATPSPRLRLDETAVVHVHGPERGHGLAVGDGRVPDRLSPRLRRSRARTTTGRSSPGTRPRRSTSRSIRRSRGRRPRRCASASTDGAGSIVVPLTGTGGVSELTVDPDPIEFDDRRRPRNNPQFIDVTVTDTTATARVVGPGVARPVDAVHSR